MIVIGILALVALLGVGAGFIFFRVLLVFLELFFSLRTSISIIFLFFLYFLEKIEPLQKHLGVYSEMIWELLVLKKWNLWLISLNLKF